MTAQTKPALPIAEYLMKLTLPSKNRAELISDFREAFKEERTAKGRLRAELWYLKQWTKLTWGRKKNTHFWSSVMFKNHLTVAYRHLRKQKVDTTVSLLSLGLGLMCGLMILLYIQDELKYDRFHHNADRIFRVVLEVEKSGQANNANGPFGLGPILKREFPDVIEQVRIRKMGQSVSRYVGYEDKKFNERRFFFAEPSLFSIFDFPLVKGDATTALSAPNTIVITEEMAIKYFGDQDPMGKTLEADPYNTGDFMHFQVTGVALDVPTQSHIHFDFLASYTSQTEDLNRLNGIWQHYTYLLLKSAQSAPVIATELEDCLIRHWRADPWYTPRLQPLLDIHLHSGLNSEVQPVGRYSHILIFSAVGLIVLLIAAINFVNLSTARSYKRLREIGMRKTLGATRDAVQRQLLGESVGFALLAGFTAILAFYMAIPTFNDLTGKTMTWHHLATAELLLPYLIIVLTLGLGAGMYTAVTGAALTPMHMLKQAAPGRTAGRRLREILVTLQFVLTLTLIIITLAVKTQMQFIRQADTGYDRRKMLILPLNSELRTQAQSIKNKLNAHPGISGVTLSNYVPTAGSSHSNFQFEGRELPVSQVIYYVDKDFFQTYGLQLEAGQFIKNKSQVRGESEFLITERTVSEAGYAHAGDALGKTISFLNFNGHVSGVVRDLNIYGLNEKPYGIVFLITPHQKHNYLSIRFDPRQTAAIKAHVQSVWEEAVPSYPMESFFLDDHFNAMHRSDKQFGTVLHLFSMLAIGIACSGLFAMALLAAQQRRREMGIRKALGATTTSLYFFLSREFVKWTLTAAIISWPLAYVLIKKWLSTFAYQAPVSFWWFLISTLTVVCLTLLTISWQAYNTACSNPAITLKTE